MSKQSLQSLLNQKNILSNQLANTLTNTANTTPQITSAQSQNTNLQYQIDAANNQKAHLSTQINSVKPEHTLQLNNLQQLQQKQPLIKNDFLVITSLLADYQTHNEDPQTQLAGQLTDFDC